MEQVDLKFPTLRDLTKGVISFLSFLPPAPPIPLTTIPQHHQGRNQLELSAGTRSTAEEMSETLRRVLTVLTATIGPLASSLSSSALHRTLFNPSSTTRGVQPLLLNRDALVHELAVYVRANSATWEVPAEAAEQAYFLTELLRHPDAEQCLEMLRVRNEVFKQDEEGLQPGRAWKVAFVFCAMDGCAVMEGLKGCARVSALGLGSGLAFAGWELIRFIFYSVMERRGTALLVSIVVLSLSLSPLSKLQVRQANFSWPPFFLPAS